MNIAFVYMNNEINIGIGAGYVASSIIRAGNKLTFFDTFLTPIKDIAKSIIRNDFDILMISSMTMLFPDALKLVRIVKKQKKIPVLVGGVHPTIMGKQILERHEEIDYLCIGEGESMVIDFLNNFGKDSLFNVQNLAYRRNGKIYSNPLRPAEDLSKLPPFPWHFFHKEAIVLKNGFLYVNATRGCPYNCTYCCNSIYLSIYGKSYIRFRPIEKVIEELEYLNKRYSPRLFYFGDEMALSNTKYAIELFENIKNKLSVPYGCMCRVEYITPDIVKIFKKTGCEYVGIGVECGNEEFRKMHLNRRMSNQEIINAFSLVKQAGIFVTSFNMIGYPFNNDDFLTNETIKLNKIINPDFVQITIFYPFPGTKLYQRCMDMDLIDPRKAARSNSYFEDSVLKGVSLLNKRYEINLLLNPPKFRGMRYLQKALYLFYSYSHGRLFIRYFTQKIPPSMKAYIIKSIRIIKRQT